MKMVGVPEEVLDEVASLIGWPKHQLLRNSRGVKREADARFVAYYLINVGLNYSMRAVGKLFGRNRTTIKWGVGKVEDRRDDPTFSQWLDRMEEELRLRLSRPELVPVAEKIGADGAEHHSDA